MASPLLRKTSLLSHERDPAFRLALRLQALANRISLVRGTAHLRNKLRRSIFRVAHHVGDAELMAAPAERQRPYEAAARALRSAMISLRSLVDHGGVVTAEQHREMENVALKLWSTLGFGHESPSEEIERGDELPARPEFDPDYPEPILDEEQDAEGARASPMEIAPRVLS
jgi:hypothetical protein